MLYELAEQCYPFGERPEFNNLLAEFLQPQFLGDDEETEVPHMYSLVSGLLDWDPKARLQGKALREHDYWRSPDGLPADWELIEERQLPSPLLPIVEQRRAAHSKKMQARGSAWRRQDSATKQVSEDLADAAAEQAKVDLATNDESFGSFNKGSFNKNKDNLESLIELENEMRVVSWEFNSPHAIALEYLESNQEGGAGVGLRLE